MGAGLAFIDDPVPLEGSGYGYGPIIMRKEERWNKL